MPPIRENPLRTFVRGIERERGVSFGTPWLAEGGSGLVVPVLRTSASTRRYVLADEVRGGLLATDTGRIDRVRMDNTTEARVFLPPGILLRGKGTTSRGTVAGILLEPRSRTDVEVRCIHPSHAVVRGATLEPAHVAPPQRVYEALLARDQGRVWATIAEIQEGLRGSEGEAGSQPESDDLLDWLEKAHVAEIVPESIRAGNETPDSQCGVLVLDREGVLAAEIFDSPASWNAAREAILARIAPHPAPGPASPLKPIPDPQVTMDRVRDFLGDLDDADRQWLAAGTWVSGRLLVQYSTLGGEVIHLSASRREDPERPRPTGRPLANQRTVAGPVPAVDSDSGFVSAPASEGLATEGEGEAVATGSPMVDWEEMEPAPPIAPERRRKVLTSGWDGTTFQALERYSSKECGGDRSSAVRFLVRQGLRRRGYLSPLPMSTERTPPVPISETAMPAPGLESEQRTEEARIHDLGRIADETGYAGWLRERARTELQRIATAAEDEALRGMARWTLDRLRPMTPVPELPEPEPVEAPAPEPTVDVRSLLRKALEASGTGKYPQALALFDEILRHEPHNRTALLGRAVALRRAGRAQEALEGLDRVFRLEPENAAALLNRGRILHERGDLSEALEAFDRLVAVAPNDWDVWMARGDVLMRLERPREALASYGAALRRNPDDEKLQRKARAAELATRPVHVKTSDPSPLPFGVEEGQSYLVVERGGGTSYRVLRSLAERQLPSLVVSHQPPERIRHEHDLAGAKVVGLSHAIGPDLHDPTALASLARVIERFVEENRGRGVVLLEGLNRLIADNGFRDAILFVEHVNEVVLQRRAIFLVSVNPEGLAERELALLERTLKLLTEGLDLG